MPKDLEQQVLRRFGREQGGALWAKAEAERQQLLPLAEGESKGRKKNLVDGIYPVVALYRVLLREGMDRDTAMEHMSVIMEARTRAGNRKQYETLGRLPFFFSLFRKLFRTGLRGDSWTVDWEADNREAFVYTVRTCLWHQACGALGCPELCRLFCRNDEINFTDVSPHLYFQRSTALGYGGDCCDFHFYPRPPKSNL